ncbi:unnamed protein product [Phytophthora fragariaefolia]|uniref:Unnamed protein product n=1 Tax=Phytophthora fragariaefolia TaxID=1490495 RepID=A0A9W6X5N5_9STRA|nr:unnamed protein product [Phytophthora fragariaefolia]
MEDSRSRLPARQDVPHLSDAHWATLEKMVSLLGEADFAGFPNLPAEQQRGRVGRFDKYESSLIAQMSAAAQEAARATMRAEAQSAAQASATNTASLTARLTTTKPVKISVKTFDGKDSDRLVLWVREIEIALSAGQFYDARAQVAFACPILEGTHAHGPWPVKRQPSRRQTWYGAAILKDPSDPYHPLLKEFSDVVSDPPSVLLPDWGVRHEIDLVPGTKYCATRDWPLPRNRST